MLALGYDLGKGADDETPWCGLFVAHCMGFSLPGEAQPANPFGARNWPEVRSLDRDASRGRRPRLLARQQDGWSGHVGFYAGERKSDGALHVLGGNQSNAVTEAWLDRGRLLGIRWPSTYPMPSSGRVVLTSAGKLSTNEA